MTIGCEIPADEWGDDDRCPNCKGRDVVEFSYKIGSVGVRRTCLECRDCGAYSTWRLHAPPTPDS